MTAGLTPVESLSAALMVAEDDLRAAQEHLSSLQPAYIDAQQRVAVLRRQRDELTDQLQTVLRGPKLHPLVVASFVKRVGFSTGRGEDVAPMDPRPYVNARAVDPWTVAVDIYGSNRARVSTDFAVVLHQVHAALLKDGRFVVRTDPAVPTELFVTAKKES